MDNQLSRSPLPHSVETEQAVLAALLGISAQENYLSIAEYFYPHHFYNAKNAKIAEAIKNTFDAGKELNVLNVTHELNRLGYQDVKLYDLMNHSFSTTIFTNKVLESYLYIIELYKRRNFIEFSAKSQAEAADLQKDIFDIEGEAFSFFMQTENEAFTNDFKPIATATAEYLNGLENRLENGVSGVDTGFKQLNQTLGGWRAGELYVLAARPAMGKTALGLQMVRNVTGNGLKAAFMSLEMPYLQLAERLIANETKTSISDLRDANFLDAEQVQDLTAKSVKLADCAIFVNDSVALKIAELQSMLAKLQKMQGLDIVFIDYLQLLTGSKRNREQEINEIAMGLKNMAKLLNIPVIALSQLSRAVEHRPTKKPQLSDLRESGGIEQAADCVLMLYRPDYYGITEDENGESVEGKAEIIVAKNRNGAVRSCWLDFEGEYSRFVETT